jgi:hypothetical protein
MRFLREGQMKWLLVAVVLGIAPVKTELIYDTIDECLKAESAMRALTTFGFDGRAKIRTNLAIPEARSPIKDELAFTMLVRASRPDRLLGRPDRLLGKGVAV